MVTTKSNSNISSIQAR